MDAASEGIAPGTAAPTGGRPEKNPKEKHVCVVDKRRVGKDEGGGAATEPDLKPSFVQELEDRVHRAEATLKERLALLDEETRRSRLRLQQDLELRYEEREHKLLLDVLGILDDLRRACTLASADPAVAEGLSLIGGRVTQFLAAHECVPFSPEGEEFDPLRMEAVALAEGPPNRVVSVFQPGILCRDKLLRAAKVSVGRAPQEI